MAYVISKEFSDLSAGVRRQLRGLTFREDSSMRKILRDEPNVRVFVAFLGKRVVSWGMLSETFWHPKLTYMTYTRRADRRKGYGSEVFKVAKTWKNKHRRKQTVVWFHTTSDGGRGFFKGRKM